MRLKFQRREHCSTIKVNYFKTDDELEPRSEKLKGINNSDRRQDGNSKSIPFQLHIRAMNGSSCGRLRKLKQKCLMKDIDFNRNSYSAGFKPLHMKVNRNGKSLVMKIRQGRLFEKLCLYEVNCDKHYGINLKYSFEVSFAASLINCFTWNPNENDQLLISYAKRNLPHLSNSELALLNRYRQFVLRRHDTGIINCVAWNSYPHGNSLVSTGSDRAVMLIDVNSERHYVQPLITKTAPKVIKFCKYSPGLFIGCESDICHYDYRCDGTMYLNFTQNTMKSHINGLYILDDENYIIVSSLDGTIYKMDVRLHKIVMEYEGHVNCDDPRVNFLVDRRHDFMFAFGSDSLLRCWDIKTGSLEHVSSGATARFCGDYPKIEYSDAWNGDHTLSGFLCAYDNKFEMWPFLN